VRGRSLLRWNFQISELISRWTVQAGAQSQNVGAEGSFWADAETLDLARVEIRATGLLPLFPLSEVANTIDYARVYLTNRPVLLPQSGELRITQTDGSRRVNRTQFSHCRQYAAESSISFGSPSGSNKEPEGVKPEDEVFELASGLRVSIRLDAAIDLEHARIGDRIEGSLASSIREGRRDIAPKGANVLGRVRRVEKDSSVSPHYTVGLEFDEVRFPGHLARFYGTLRGIDSPAPGISYFVTKAQTQEIRTAGGGRTTITRGETMSAPEIPGVGVFLVDGASARIAAGTVMTWVTESVKSH